MKQEMRKNNSFVLYGATGYTARLIIEKAKEYELYPILAGRNEEKLKKLSQHYGFPFEHIELADDKKLKQVFSSVNLVLNCAGPFVHTFQPIVMACMSASTHYLDITGEIDVFEFLAKQSNNAKKSNMMLLPGMGFDVVPSDCLASWLHSMLPEGNYLSLAIKTEGIASRGTMKTVVESLHRGGMIREKGVIRTVKNAYDLRMIDFGEGPVRSMTIPWGDVSTAYYTTGIENIMTYMANPPISPFLMRISAYFNSILKSKIFKDFLRSRINKMPEGPDLHSRNKNKSMVWGEVSTAGNKKISGIFKGPEGYSLTADSCLLGIKKILNGQFKTGYQTPASVFGDDFIMEIPNTERYLLE